MNLEIYQKLCSESKVLWTQHCLQRMQERDISRADVKNGIATGEIIEDYPEDYPNPSCLIFGYTQSIIIIGKNKGKRSKPLPNHTDLSYCLIDEKKHKESV